ncbi:MAG: RNA methyltransferase [Lachnospiraceae bacterium]|nr:RNA methyltransferase [Lachnospiraceae bacterium]
MNFIEINDITDPELEIFSRYSEVQLYHLNEPENGVFIAESANVVLRALEDDYEPVKILVEKERIDTEGKQVFEAVIRKFGEEFLDSLPVYTAGREIVTLLTGYKLVRGLWTVFRRKDPVGLTDFLKDKSRIVLLYDVVNPTNVGAIIRSAAALGMDGALLTYASVDPLTRRSARVSMGTVFKLPWTKVRKKDPSGLGLLDLLGDSGFTTAAMALTTDTVPVDHPDLKNAGKLAVILGTEGYGLPDEIINASDHRIMIPMHHGVDSLNVAAASAVCFYELMKNT